jgi:group I intron endonuclease
MSYTVYKHTGPTGKVYIGITSQPLRKRWGADGSGYNHSPHFRAAIERYGWGAFKHKIMAEGLTKELAEQIEIDLIEAHRSTDRRFGYNTDRGGSTGAKHTTETKRKIGEANRQRVWTAEARQKLSAYKKAHPTPPEVSRKIGEANRGRRHRPESIEKMRASHPKRAVKNIDTGNLYNSVTEASKATGTNLSKIVDVCRGRRKTAGGHHWAYEEVIT